MCFSHVKLGEDPRAVLDIVDKLCLLFDFGIHPRRTGRSLCILASVDAPVIRGSGG